jgi:1D-myo-inositol-triphosphate 3-kinase
MKLGTRTFLESEVLNTKPRTDLFDKMYKIDSNAFTEEELASKSVTKLRYMQFREKLSSTNDLGFRIEGVKLHNEHLDINFQRLKDESSISSILHKFCGKYRHEFKEKLEFIRECVESSAFVAYHEFVGCSVLMIQDERQCGCWIIDFAKTFESDKQLNHRRPWNLGNREDGLLTGLDNIIRLIE